ncbi:MAG TPA: molybdopterin-guanine dinucleotide biosynthesis protein B [Candidatus Korarchaeota archaeon]|nr:molybdopterin-guanine dinucleotide biosynthesis protein B [Candidatus Korarchaeota archaeon]
MRSYNAVKASKPLIVAVVGRKSSGKTTLIEELTKRLIDRGLRVAAIKHTCELEVKFDFPGTDTWRMRQSGASAVMLVSPSCQALIAEGSLDLDSAVDLLVRAVSDVDVVLVEGFKSQTLPREDALKVIVSAGEGDEEFLEKSVGKTMIVRPVSRGEGKPHLSEDDIARVVSEISRLIDLRLNSTGG